MQVAGSYSKVRSLTVGGRVALPTQHLRFFGHRNSASSESDGFFALGRKNGRKVDALFLVPTPHNAWSFALLSLHVEDLGPNL